MKLIDLLVQELPKMGGWPVESSVLSIANLIGNNQWSYGRDTHGTRYFESDETGEIVTQKQYESALAASQQKAWDGEGLPPVGLHIEYTCKRFSEHKAAILPEYWYCGKIIAYYEGFVWTSDNGIRPLENTIFRPARTEAERKREEAAKLINNVFYEYDNKGEYFLRGEGVYDAIAAGKIPGVKLEDS